MMRVERNSALDTEVLLWNKWRNSRLTVKRVPQKTQDTTKRVVNWTKIS